MKSQSQYGLELRFKPGNPDPMHLATALFYHQLLTREKDDSMKINTQAYLVTTLALGNRGK